MTDSSRRPAAGRPLGDGRFGIWTSYEDKARVKALPGARWDAGLRCWTVSMIFRPEAEALIASLNSAGTTRPSGGQVVPLSSAFQSLFVALADPWRQPVYRALAKVLHPDAGGDTATAQALTDAWSRVR